MQFFAIFSTVITVLTETVICLPERSFEVKIIKRATEIATRNNNQNEEDRLKSNTSDTTLPVEELKLWCREGKEAVEKHESGIAVHFLENDPVTGKMAAYLFSMKEKTNIGGVESWTTSLGLLSVFTCPTLPKSYIHVNEYNEETGNMKLFAIVQDRSLLPNLSDIKSILINFADDIREAYVDEIELTNSQQSSFDFDEFFEDERLQMCHKAWDVIPNLNKTFIRSARPGRNKYYSMKLLELPVSQEAPDPPNSSATEESTFIEAFQCPTDPEIYVHVSNEDRNGHTFGVITKKSETPSLTLNIVAYLVRSVSFVKKAPPKYVQENNQKVYNGKSVVNFDLLEPKERHEMCETAVRVFLGRSVTLAQNIGIGPSKFYNMRPAVTVRAPIQAIRCPTEDAPPVYLHITGRKEGGNVMWVIIERGNFNPFVKLVESR